VGIQRVQFDGYADMVRKIETKARMHLSGPKQGEIVGVIGLLDLFGPDFYPTEKTSADERFAWGKAHFEASVGDSRFRMFFAVHEFEAWLISQPSIFPREVKSELETSIPHPERVNFHEPPAKLLDRVYKLKMRRSYKKTTYGRQLFAKLDPTVAVSKCPYLKSMLDEMLAMAKAAGL